MESKVELGANPARNASFARPTEDYALSRFVNAYSKSLEAIRSGC